MRRFEEKSGGLMNFRSSEKLPKSSDKLSKLYKLSPTSVD
jgi:hypothetical protein